MLFLGFIDDLTKSVKSIVRLYADDCVLYRDISNETDCPSVQSDLGKLEMWEDHGCMSFNANKCSSISITRKANKNHSELYSLKPATGQSELYNVPRCGTHPECHLVCTH